MFVGYSIAMLMMVRFPQVSDFVSWIDPMSVHPSDVSSAMGLFSLSFTMHPALICAKSLTPSIVCIGRSFSFESSENQIPLSCAYFILWISGWMFGAELSIESPRRFTFTAEFELVNRTVYLFVPIDCSNRSILLSNWFAVHLSSLLKTDVGFATSTVQQNSARVSPDFRYYHLVSCRSITDVSNGVFC